MVIDSRRSSMCHLMRPIQSLKFVVSSFFIPHPLSFILSRTVISVGNAFNEGSEPSTLNGTPTRQLPIEAGIQFRGTLGGLWAS